MLDGAVGDTNPTSGKGDKSNSWRRTNVRKQPAPAGFENFKTSHIPAHKEGRATSSEGGGEKREEVTEGTSTAERGGEGGETSIVESRDLTPGTCGVRPSMQRRGSLSVP